MSKGNEYTWLDQEEVINHSWISAKEIQILVPVGICNARKIISDIRKDMLLEGAYTFNCKTILVPTQRVLKKLGLNEKNIREQAKRMRDAA